MRGKSQDREQYRAIANEGRYIMDSSALRRRERKFTNVSTVARYWYLSRARLMQTASPFYFYEIRLNIVFPSLFIILVISLSGFPTKTLNAFCSSLMRAICHTNLIIVDFIAYVV